MNFRWKFRFRPVINEYLSEEVIPHMTRDNKTAPGFQNCGDQRAYTTVNGLLSDYSHACILLYHETVSFPFQNLFLTVQSTTFSVSSCGSVFQT